MTVRVPWRDSFGIAVANWWLRRVLTVQCLAQLDANNRRGLLCTCNAGGAAIETPAGNA